MPLLKWLLRGVVDDVIDSRDDVVTRSEVGEIVEEYTADLDHDLTVEITQHVEDRIDDVEGGGGAGRYRAQPDASSGYGEMEY